MSPLDRGHTTIGGWTAALGYPVFCVVVGRALVFDDTARLRATPAFDFASGHLDAGWVHIHVPFLFWGIGYLLLGAVLALALLRKDRALYQNALGLAMAWMAVWTVVLVAAYFFGTASSAAWAWPAIVGWHMWAVQLSLASRQRDAP